MTDVGLSAGVIAGVGLIAVTGWNFIDPIVALIVAVKHVWTGVGLVRRSVDGLMDVASAGRGEEGPRSLMAKYRLKKWISMRCARDRQPPSVFSRCTCWCQAIGVARCAPCCRGL